MACIVVMNGEEANCIGSEIYEKSRDVNANIEKVQKK